LMQVRNGHSLPIEHSSGSDGGSNRRGNLVVKSLDIEKGCADLLQITFDGFSYCIEVISIGLNMF